MSKVISEIVENNGTHRRALVQTSNGKFYIVDTNDTFDVGMETMVFLGREGSIFVESWRDLYSRQYDDLESAIEGHNEIANDLEKYLMKKQIPIKSLFH